MFYVYLLLIQKSMSFGIAPFILSLFRNTDIQGGAESLYHC